MLTTAVMAGITAASQPSRHVSPMSMIGWLLAFGMFITPVLLTIIVIRARRGLTARIVSHQYSVGPLIKRALNEFRTGLARLEQHLADEVVLAMPRGVGGLMVPARVTIAIAPETYAQIAQYTTIVADDVRGIVADVMSETRRHTKLSAMQLRIVPDSTVWERRPEVSFEYGPSWPSEAASTFEATVTDVTAANRDDGGRRARRPPGRRPGDNSPNFNRSDEELTQAPQPIRLRQVGGDSGADIEVRHGHAIVVGRSSSCDVRLKDAMASRHHARLELVVDHLNVTDLDSRHGSWVGVRRVEGSTVAEIGEQVRFAETTYRVEAG